MDDRTDESLFGADDAPAAPPSAYRVLARKYRPTRFEDLIGQEPMVRTLSNAFERGRIAQAYMLTGVRGVGKTTTARIIARALNYQTEDGSVAGPTLVMPGLGIHCPEILDSRHVDVLEMDAASNTGIDNIREIIEAVRYKPSSARYKVYIVDEVHMLSKAAFNGLLKTLEEPPEHVKFIFATTEIRKVPITVLSRCQRFDLRRVEADQLVVHLQSVASQEGVTANADALAMIVRASEGSVRDALSLLDQAIAHGAGAVEAETTRDMLGLADRGMVIDLFEAVMRGDVPGALDIFDSQYNIGAEPSAVLGDLARFTHLVTRLKVVPDAASDRSLSETERDRATEMAPGLSMADLTRTWQILLKGIPEVDTASLPKAAADMLVVRLAYAASLPSPEDALKALGDGRDTTGGRVGGASAAPQRPSGGGPASAALRVSDPRIADPIASASPRSEASAAQPRSHLSLASDRSAPEPMAQTTPDAELPTIAYAGPALATLEDVVALADDKRDRLLAAQITRYVRLVAMQPGRIEMNLEAGAPTDLMQTLGRKLYDWTGARWMISLSREPGAEPLRVQAEAARQAVMDDIRDSPTVAAVLATFPGAKIVNVRFPDNEDDDAEDDGTPDPPIDPDDLDTEDDLL